MSSFYEILTHLQSVLLPPGEQSVSMDEDANRTRRGNGAKNLGVLRRLALSLIRQVQGKQSVPNIMWRAALSKEFRTNIIEKIINEKV